jgi:hypothetical protein
MKQLKHLLSAILLITTLCAQAQVGIGTATPASSAQLDVNSTTKGLLPPQMTAAQRNAIVNPAKGLMLYCTNCGTYGEPEYFNGTTWVNMLGSVVIGSAYQGGIIAYVLVSGDPGYDANTPHGLIAAATNQSTGIRWYNGSNTVTGAIGTAIGTGLINTNMIITNQGVATTYAAGLARTYNGGGYTDWYLPSKDELNKLYLNKVAIGGFGTNFYWSSTEFNSTDASTQDFINGVQYNSAKAYPFYVRAVRTF